MPRGWGRAAHQRAGDYNFIQKVKPQPLLVAAKELEPQGIIFPHHVQNVKIDSLHYKHLSRNDKFIIYISW